MKKKNEYTVRCQERNKMNVKYVVAASKVGSGALYDDPIYPTIRVTRTRPHLGCSSRRGHLPQ